MEETLRILLVDDHPADRFAIKRFLSKSGLSCAVDELEHGEDVLHMIHEHAYDCVVLDYDLPKPDGLDVLQALNSALSRTPPIIFLTGKGCEQIAVECFKSGAADYLRKDHCSPDTLRRCIEDALIRHLERKADQAETERLRYASCHDMLTGLPNRTLFDDRLTQSLEVAARDDASFAVAFLDLNGFKPINDQHGHDAGDEVLRQTAARIQQALRRSDTVARIGGDEFAVIVRSANDPEAAIHVAEKLQEVISHPIEHGGALAVDASIGLALYPQHGSCEDELLHHADEAMYDAKHNGLDWAFYRGDWDDDRQQQRRVLSKDLRRGVAAEDLVLEYQPIIELRSGAPASVEVLTRWRHPALGLLPPMEFIPMAEGSSAIADITATIVDKALAQQATWQSAGLAFEMAINLSPRVIASESFFEWLTPCFLAHDVDLRSVTLEITETALLANTQTVRANIEQLVELGFTIALDDFGTGYSSISTLRDFPIGALKIDKSFVAQLDGSTPNEAIVGSILHLADALDVSSVAEGIESAATLEYLHDNGCRYGQGFHFARPMSAVDLQSWLAGRERETARARRNAAA